jgi:lactoylglutathione lyase
MLTRPALPQSRFYRRQILQLASPHLDIGLMTQVSVPLLSFWQALPGVSFDRTAVIKGGSEQHRFLVLGSALKINRYPGPLIPTASSGYRALLIAVRGIREPQALTDPDGNRASLVGPDYLGIRQIGICIGVRDMARHREFFGHVLGLPEEGHGTFRVGESLVLLEEDSATSEVGGIAGLGWRYITFHVRDLDAEHARALARGAREGRCPETISDAVRISMLRDPDGNWIELAQRVQNVPFGARQ